ncbi:MAG: OmpA family protein [Saprospiraceae bacterium]|nr:OmpA family protein [Saprospiraceae bacterium]
MRLKNLLLPCLLIFLATSCVSKKKFTALEAEKNALSQSLSNLEEKVDMIQEENTKLNADKSDLTAKVASVEDQLSTQKKDTDMRLAEMNTQVENKQEQINSLRNELQSAFSDVEKAVSESGQRITEIEDMLYLDLENPINFSSGSARLSREDNETLDELADMLNKNPGMSLIIEGHTDDRPINTARYKDNWDLSVARSISIVRKLIAMGVNPKQLTAAGKAEFAPRVTGDPKSAETRAANRRSEVMIVPQIGKLYDLSKKKSGS